MARPETVARWIEEAGVEPEKVKYRTDGTPVIWRSCPRCGGSGVFWFNTAAGPMNGTCFRCGGSKGVWVKLQSVAANKRGKPRRIEKAKEKRAADKRSAVVEARHFLATHEGLAAALRHERAKGSILRSFANQLARRGGLTDRQVEVAFEIAARPPKPAEPELVPVIEGRVTVSGKVLTTKWQRSQFGEQLKMLVLVETDAGEAYKVWGTVPKAIDEVERGEFVNFTATFERSKDDESFGFFKRPTQATRIYPEA